MIVVIGDILIDEYIYGTSTRLSPEAPVPVVKFLEKERKFGGAANVYNNIKSLTQDVELVDITNCEMFPCLLYTSPSPRDLSTSRMPSSA